MSDFEDDSSGTPSKFRLHDKKPKEKSQRLNQTQRRVTRPLEISLIERSPRKRICPLNIIISAKSRCRLVKVVFLGGRGQESEIIRIDEIRLMAHSGTILSNNLNRSMTCRTDCAQVTSGDSPTVVSGPQLELILPSIVQNNLSDRILTFCLLDALQEQGETGQYRTTLHPVVACGITVNSSQ